MIGEVQKNSDGHLGKICNWCGGYGFTNVITGGSRGCPKCDQTGVEPVSNEELLNRIKELESKLI
jgi:hypothetical protein